MAAESSYQRQLQRQTDEPAAGILASKCAQKFWRENELREICYRGTEGKASLLIEIISQVM